MLHLPLEIKLELVIIAVRKIVGGGRVMATCTITRIGNSVGVTLPKVIRGDVFRIGDKVDLRADDGKIVIEPATKRPTFDSLMEGYDGSPPSCIDMGRPCGKEIW